MFPAAPWKRLKLFALDATDLALTKLERNAERDREDNSPMRAGTPLGAIRAAALSRMLKHLRGALRCLSGLRRAVTATLNLLVVGSIPTRPTNLISGLARLPQQFKP